MVVSQGEALFVLTSGAVSRLCMVSSRPFGADLGAYMRLEATVDYFEIVSLFPNVTEPPIAGSCLVYPGPC
jgi:hypothetical protein